MTQSEIEELMEGMVVTGDLARHVGPDGERTYSLTPQGIAATEELMRERGVDPETMKGKPLSAVLSAMGIKESDR